MIFLEQKKNEFDQHNLENFKRFDSYLKGYGLDYVLGVIPAHTWHRELTWLNEQPNITVAMHGALHIEYGYSDEFHNTQSGVIEGILLLAKNRLEASSNKRVVDYIPPRNDINHDTILALSRLGFENVYGGPGAHKDTRQIVEHYGMNYIYSNAPLEYGRTDELLERGSVEHLAKEVPKRDVCLTLHWPWEWNICLNHLIAYMDRICYLWS